MRAKEIIEAATLADFTSESLIEAHLTGREASAVIQELSRLLRREMRVPDILQFYHAALNREYLLSTAVEDGMAFPHARLPGFEQLSFALGRTADPIEWGSKKTIPVRLVILTAVPATDATSYLTLLSAMARLGKEPEMIEQIHAAKSAKDILPILRKFKLRRLGTAPHSPFRGSS